MTPSLRAQSRKVYSQRRNGPRREAAPTKKLSWRSRLDLSGDYIEAPDAMSNKSDGCSQAAGGRGVRFAKTTNRERFRRLVRQVGDLGLQQARSKLSK